MDSRKYEQIVRDNIDTIYRIALSYTKTPSDADDVVQQVFMKLLTKPADFNDEVHIKKWLIKVCVNECNSLFSSFWRKNVASMDSVSEEITFIDQGHSELYEAIKTLPSKCKIVVYLFYYEGYATKEK